MTNTNNITIQFFGDAWRRSPWVDDMDFLAESISAGVLEKSNTEWARALIADGDIGKYEEKKGGMFRMFSAGAIYDGNGFRKENVVALTGYVTIDIDDISDTETACMVRDGLSDDDDVLHPVLCFVSPSGLGVKAVFKVDGLAGGGTFREMSERYALAYKRLNGVIALHRRELFGDDVEFVLDSSGCDMTRCCLMAHDPMCRYSPDSVTSIPYGDDELFGALAEVGFTAKSDTRGGEYDEGAHRLILDEIIATLHRDSGSYIYNREKSITVGHRGDGTDVVEIDGRRGYDVMLQLNSTAMLLFGNDRDAADGFLRSVFPEYAKRGWNRVTKQHGECLPAVSVLNWLINELEFERDERPKFVTGMTIEGALNKREYFADDDGFINNGGLPPILTRWLTDTSVPSQFRDIRFYSAIALISGFAVNQGIFINGGSRRNLNLQMLVIGKQGSGKSEMGRPYNILMPSLDRFCSFLSDKEMNRRKNEMRGGEKTTMNVAGDPFAILGDDVDEGCGGRALSFSNKIGKPTYAAILRVLPSNNGKCVMMTSELSIWDKMEKSKNAGIKDAMKVFYDNDTLSNETVTNIDSGSTTHCYNCNCSVLASGTPDQFRELFSSVEGGELRRGLVFLTEDENWRMMPFFSNYPDNSDIESFFLQWYFYHFYSGRVTRYVPNESNAVAVYDFFDKYVPEIESVFGGITTTEEAMSALIRSVHVTVIRIAALIQSLCEFYAGNKWRRDFDLVAFNRTHNVTVWDDGLGKWVERTPDDYIALARSSMKGYAEAEEVVDLKLDYVWMAQRIVHRRIFDALTAIETHDKRTLPMGVSNPSSIKYREVLKKLPTYFTPAQYQNAYKILFNEDVTKQYVQSRLKRLVVEVLIKKQSHGLYENKMSEI